MNKTLYLTRHGQTTFNVEKRFQGQQNSELTQRGIDEAKQLGKYLENTPLDAVFTSPLKRAYDSAVYIVGNRKIDIIKLDELMEIDVADWTGKTIDEIESMDGEQYYNFIHNINSYNRTQGESYADLYFRLKRGLEKIINSKYENILIVSHGIALNMLIYNIRDIKLENVSEKIHVLRGSSLSKFEYKDSKSKEIFYNKSEYLDNTGYKDFV